MNELKKLREAALNNMTGHWRPEVISSEIDAALVEAFQLGAKAEREASLEYLGRYGYVFSKFIKRPLPEAT